MPDGGSNKWYITLSPICSSVECAGSLKIVDMEGLRAARSRKDDLSPLVSHNQSPTASDPLVSIPNISIDLNITQSSSFSRSWNHAHFTAIHPRFRTWCYLQKLWEMSNIMLQHWQMKFKSIHQVYRWIFGHVLLWLVGWDLLHVPKVRSLPPRPSFIFSKITCQLTFICTHSSLYICRFQLRQVRPISGYPMFMTNLWRAYRILEHLWIPRFALGLGSAMVSATRLSVFGAYVGQATLATFSCSAEWIN